MEKTTINEKEAGNGPIFKNKFLYSFYADPNDVSGNEWSNLMFSQSEFFISISKAKHWIFYDAWTNTKIYSKTVDYFKKSLVVSMSAII